MLVVETASAMKKRGHHVEVFTSFHDPRRAFTETVDGTLDVHVHDSIVPRSIFGKFIQPLATIRFFWTAAKVMMRHKNLSGGYDIIFVDQISLVIPLLKYSGARVIFYCHYPDMLLTTRTNLLKKAYRMPIDYLEQITTAQAHEILVNSNYTLGVFQKTFTSIDKIPTVLYPTVHAERITVGSPNRAPVLPSSPSPSSEVESESETTTQTTTQTTRISIDSSSESESSSSASSTKVTSTTTTTTTKITSSTPNSPDYTQVLPSTGISRPVPAVTSGSRQLAHVPERFDDLVGLRYLLSLNRYERKKNHYLAIDTMVQLLKKMDEKDRKDLRLVIAGGYDERVHENVEHLEELRAHAKKSGVEDVVKFYTKVPDVERNWLLWNSRVVLYTPENEHFGIVPLEAGVALRPVIACNSGGPLESIIDGVTGFHCPTDPDLWAEKVKLLLDDEAMAKQFGEAAVKRVISHFSPNVILPKLENIMYDLNLIVKAQSQWHDKMMDS